MIDIKFLGAFVIVLIILTNVVSDPLVTNWLHAIWGIFIAGIFIFFWFTVYREDSKHKKEMKKRSKGS